MFKIEIYSIGDQAKASLINWCLLPMQINNQKLISTTNNPTTNGCHYVQNTITNHQLVDNITISNYLLWEEEPRGLAGKTGSVRDHIILPSCIYHHNQDSGLAHMHSVAYMYTCINVYPHNQDTAATYVHTFKHTFVLQPINTQHNVLLWSAELIIHNLNI